MACASPQLYLARKTIYRSYNDTPESATLLLMNNEAITRDYLTPQQVAELYHVSESAVYRWIKQGWIEADKVHGKNAKVGRYRISPLILDEMDKKRDMLVEESKRYWMRLYVKLGMKKR